MAGKDKALQWITAGTFAAALFASASPAQARDGWGHRGLPGFRHHARVSVYARPFFPRVHYLPYSHFYRPYFAVRVFEPYPYAYYGVRRAYWPHRFVAHRRYRY
jgi:hypothetical protein